MFSEILLHYCISSNSQLMILSINIIHYKKISRDNYTNLRGTTKLNFHFNFLNIIISLIFQQLCFKMLEHIVETHYGGRTSYFFNIGFSFCFMACRKLRFAKRNLEKSQKLPAFSHKTKTRHQ